MSFDVLDMLNEATKEADAFEHHPLKNATLEQQMLYLQGLALVMNADADIHAEEKEYLRILIKSFGLPLDQLDDLEYFAKTPDKDTIQAFFREYRRKPVAQLFLFDALMMTRRNGKVDSKEQAVINKMTEQLEILKGTQKDIFDLFCFIRTKNWPETTLYFKSHLLSTSHFQHLLDYHEVTEDDLNLDSLKTRLEERLLADASRDIQWGEFNAPTRAQSEYQQITTRPIKSSDLISFETLLPWLQHKLERKQIRIAHELVYLCEVDEDKVLFELKSTPYLYDAERNVLQLDSKALSTTFHTTFRDKEAIKTISSCNSKDSEAATITTLYELIELFIEDLELNIGLGPDDLCRIFGASEIALGNDDGNLITCDGIQVSSITSDKYDFARDGHPNAVTTVTTSFAKVRYCAHCRSGHGSKSQICNDTDKETITIPLSEMLIEHGFFLVK